MEIVRPGAELAPSDPPLFAPALGEAEAALRRNVLRGGAMPREASPILQRADACTATKLEGNRTPGVSPR
jgi:hypothetical protein